MKREFACSRCLYRFRWNIVFMLLFCSSFPSLFSTVSIENIKTDQPPKLDGKLDDAIWQKTKGYSNFKSFVPEFGNSPREKTVIYSAYDLEYLYFAVKCYDRSPEKIVATVCKRDNIDAEDYIGIAVDSHNDSQNAYYFVVNAYGIQLDGVMDSEGTPRKSQDFVWESAGQKNADGYSVEVKIPFKSIRFSNGKIVKMRIGVIRHIPRYSEYYVFPEWKLGKGSMLGQLGHAQFDGITYKPVLEILPAFSYMRQRERWSEDMLNTSHKSKPGVTAKIGLSSKLTLDMTVNPDFSHIESDAGQVDVNLRYKPLYQEKRPFFLEGLEHFSFAGSGNDSPISKIVHTRKIVEPIFGLKVTGKIGKSSVFNSLFAIDEYPKNLPDRAKYDYYGVLRYKYLMGKDSYMGMVCTVKESDGIFCRVGGIDSRIRINGYMNTETFFLYSDTLDPAIHLDNDGYAFGGRLNFEDRYYDASIGYRRLSNYFYLDPGRLLRNSLSSFYFTLDRSIFFKSNFLKRIIVGYSGSLSRETHCKMNEYNHDAYISFDFPGSSFLVVGYNYADEIYRAVALDKNRFYITAGSQPSKKLILNVEFSTGNWPNYDSRPPAQGKLTQLAFQLQFRPSDKFYTEFTLIRDNFHDNLEEVNYYDYIYSIYRNKTVFQVNKYLSLRGIVEYNGFYRKLLSDCLLEFTYIPGTVIHLGYRSNLIKQMYSIDNRFLRFDHFRVGNSYLFFKASYLFRF